MSELIWKKVGRFMFYTTESLINEYGSGYGFIYHIRCKAEDRLTAKYNVIYGVIGEDHYHAPHGAWDQIRFEYHDMTLEEAF